MPLQERTQTLDVTFPSFFRQQKYRLAYPLRLTKGAQQMKWTTEELINMVLEMAGLDVGTDGVDSGAADHMVAFSDEDDAQTQMQGSNLSMDEVRQLFDEFEQIIRS